MVREMGREMKRLRGGAKDGHFSIYVQEERGSKERERNKMGKSFSHH